MINKRLINICRECLKYIKAVVFLNWLSLLCNIIIILVLGKSINLFLEAQTISSVYIPILAICLVGRVAAEFLSACFSHKASAQAKTTLRDMIYKKLLQLGLAYGKKAKTSEIVQSAVDGVEQLEVYFGRYLPQFFYALLAPITLFLTVSFISLETALVFIICVPLIPLSIMAFMKIAKRILKNYWNSYTDLGSTFLENLQGLTTLKVFNMDKERHKKMNEEAEGFRIITMKVLSMQLNSITIMDLIAYGSTAIGIAASLFQLSKASINLGEAFIIILLSSEFFIPLRMLGSFFHVAMNGMAAADKIFKILDLEVRNKVIKASEKELKDLDIKINNICFSYDGEREIIKNVSMEFSKGSFTAIVGQSGSGKSTIASLLLNDYTVQKGKILFNGINIDNIAFEHIYSRIALIGSSGYIFNGTILDNLLIGKSDATAAEIDRALKISNLLQFIKSLKNGVYTQTGENGAFLSGGQRQRLILARAILSNREIMIFDEATSNIDVESEELIWESISILSKEKTVIVISHRLANVVNADNIYVMDEGRLIEQGSHQELMRNKAKYYSLIESQKMLEGKVVLA